MIPPEPGGATPVAHGVDLSGLALAVGVETDVFPEGLAADAVARGPEVGRAALVGDVGDHAPDLASLDLPERVAAELEVVPLLVDRVRAAAVDQDAVLHARDQVVERDRLVRGASQTLGMRWNGTEAYESA